MNRDRETVNRKERYRDHTHVLYMKSLSRSLSTHLKEQVCVLVHAKYLRLVTVRQVLNIRPIILYEV